MPQIKEPKGGFWHSWDRNYTPWDIENDRNWRIAGLYINLIIQDMGIVDVPSNPSPGDVYIVDQNASSSTSTTSDWDEIIGRNEFWLDSSTLSSINGKIIQWVEIPRDSNEIYPEVSGEQWEMYDPVDGLTAWEPSTGKRYRYYSGSWNDITDSFSDLDDTPDDYSSANAGDLVTVNPSADGLDFTSDIADAVDAVSNAGDTPSIETGLKMNRPSASTTGRIFIASDTKEVFRDTGSSWDLLALDPGEIDPGELGFDPATQTELDNHTGDTSNPHSVDVSDIQIDADDLNFDTATQTELDNHSSTSDAHHTDPSAGTGITDEGTNQFGIEPDGVTDTELGDIDRGAEADKPSSPSSGDLYFDTSEGQVEYYNGTSWIVIATDVNALLDLSDVTVGTSRPSSPSTDDVFIDTDDNKIEQYNGTGWDDIGLSEANISLGNLGSKSHSELSDAPSGAHHTEPSAGTGITDEGTNQFGMDVVKSGNVTLSSGTAVVDTGISTSGSTFQLAIGVDDPNADTKIGSRLFWDDSAGTYKVEFVEEATSVGNPTVNYDIIQVR